jgi:hypothetical protein
LIPRIDFDQCMVVAIFLGPQRNSSGVIVSSITPNERGELVFRFDESTYQTAARLDAPEGAATQSPPVKPFGLFVIPRQDSALIVEENVQGLKDTPPQWKQRARFERLAAK